MKIVALFLLSVVSLAYLTSCAEDASQKADDDATGAVCNITSQDIAALGPLLTKLGLAMTIDGVKKLVLFLNTSVGGLLLRSGPGSAITKGLTAFISNLVVYLFEQPLNLDNIVDSLSTIVVSTLYCIANPLP